MSTINMVPTSVPPSGGADDTRPWLDTEADAAAADLFATLLGDMTSLAAALNAAADATTAEDAHPGSPAVAKLPEDEVPPANHSDKKDGMPDDPSMLLAWLGITVMPVTPLPPPDMGPTGDTAASAGDTTGTAQSLTEALPAMIAPSAFTSTVFQDPQAALPAPTDAGGDIDAAAGEDATAASATGTSAAATVATATVDQVQTASPDSQSMLQALRESIDQHAVADQKSVSTDAPARRAASVANAASPSSAVAAGSSRAVAQSTDNASRAAVDAAPAVTITVAASGAAAQSDAKSSGERRGSDVPRDTASARAAASFGNLGTPDAHVAAASMSAPSPEPLRTEMVGGTAAMPQGSQDDGLHSQIVQAVRMQWQGGAGEARVTLRPQYLGAITISLRVEQGGTIAELHVQDPQVRQWVENNEPLLKEGLEKQGLTLERLVVSGDQDDRGDRSPGDGTGSRPQEQRRPRRTWASSRGPAFEVAA